MLFAFEVRNWGSLSCPSVSTGACAIGLACTHVSTAPTRAGSAAAGPRWPAGEAQRAQAVLWASSRGGAACALCATRAGRARGARRRPAGAEGAVRAAAWARAVLKVSRAHARRCSADARAAASPRLRRILRLRCTWPSRP